MPTLKDNALGNWLNYGSSYLITVVGEFPLVERVFAPDNRSVRSSWGSSKLPLVPYNQIIYEQKELFISSEGRDTFWIIKGKVYFWNHWYLHKHIIYVMHAIDTYIIYICTIVHIVHMYLFCE